MPIYDFKCQICSARKSLSFSIKESKQVECCGVVMERTFNAPPNAAISPKHKAVKDKMAYYGIKNVETGEGITKNTNLSLPSGITKGDTI